MSTTVPERNAEARETSGAPAPAAESRRRPRRRAVVVVVVVAVVAALVAAGGVAFAVVPFDARGRAKAAPTGASLATATVREGPLAAQVNQSGTLAYAARADGTPYSVVNQARGGTYTRLPSTGHVVACGKAMYWIGDTAVPLLCGSRPAYRDLSYGDEGWDVRQLNRNLVALGYVSKDKLDPDSKSFGSKTEDALKDLQDDLGLTETGTLKVGAAVFLPGPLRIGKALVQPGTQARPGTPILQATSTDRQVTVDLDASQQSDVAKGDRVLVTLPDNRTLVGRVSRMGTVATGSADGSGESSDSGSSDTTIPVYITLKRPKKAGRLDQAPVQVQITTEGVKKALIVPVTSLVGRAGGGYAVERVGAGGARRMVPVTLGLFDNADGLVQVHGALAAGDRVVVPST